MCSQVNLLPFLSLVTLAVHKSVVNLNTSLEHRSRLLRPISCCPVFSLSFSGLGITVLLASKNDGRDLFYYILTNMLSLF